jgi:hypothetical protein
MFPVVMLMVGLAGVGEAQPQVRDPNRDLLLGRAPQARQVRDWVPSATVEVAGESSQESVRALVLWMAPTLRGAARAGEASDESAQMLSEFMAQDPARPKPPTLPAFWYNAQRPTTGRFGIHAK